ncbi:protein kinase [Streptomyces sp. YC504]|uniref:Protein kinase n=1 Tax=Streptomyces mesophilus TaxID=1775132 RepID=A0A6G4XDA4_9ACTN|nr:serine/threonine-protein kinase [Streptomyces mesophilus]NGO74631.1 protein kinase [Streptomyces mesophilus]
MEPLTGGDPRQVGPYRILMRLGEGGMGRVYLGRSPGGRTVAVKLVHAPLASTPGFRERFAREVHASRAVSGAGTAPVVAADPEADVPWLASAYIPGPSLSETVYRYGPLPEPALWRLLAGLAEALEVVHATGLVHRDLKPSNVLLSLDRPVLIDFGIARAADDAALTGTGLVVGSPGYMSPEQAEGQMVTAAGDLFALGAVLAFAATGNNPFGGGSGPELLYRIVHHEPDLTGAPEEFASVVRECLSRRPESRPSPSALKARAAARTEPGGDWLPAPVASAIARRGEVLLNLEAEEIAPGSVADRVPPTAVVTEVTPPRPASPHTAPTRTAGADAPTPPPSGFGPPPAPHAFPQTSPPYASGHGAFHHPAPPGPTYPQPTYPGPAKDVARRRGGVIAAVVALAVAGVVGVALALNSGDGDGSSGAQGGGATSSAPAVERSEAPPVADSQQPTEPEAEDPSPVTGEWRGTYTCLQGNTGLTLTMSEDSGTVAATFDFYAVDSNPDVPPGTFAMKGTFSGGRLELLGDRWIQQPEDYLMVGLAADVDGESPQTITGTVMNDDGTPSDSCSTFTVQKN